ncbi:MAG: hypothetical protein DBX44_06805 [Oscillospiraceae bacterium]|nr:MAG: hypothetical protein DBX44_06805 [Oscillospiraceae bacterium]
MNELKGKRVLISEPMPQAYEAARRLEALGCAVDFGAVISDRTSKKTAEEMKQIVKEYDGFIGMSREKFPREVLQEADRLCVIAKYGIGVDHIDLQAASEYGVLVSVSPVNRTSVAEHTIALMLALLKRLRASQRFLNRDNWRCPELADFELAEKTIGFVGLGGITREVITRLNGWGCHFIGYDPYVSSEQAAALNVQAVSWDALFETADIVSLHLPLTEQTLHCVGQKEFDRMKPSALFINTARGKLVDQAALIQAVRRKAIAGAGIDVAQREEPIPPDDPLMEIAGWDNVIVTPHSAGWTHEALQRETDLTIDNMILALQGKLPSFVVNQDAVDGWRSKVKKRTSEENEE